MDLNKVKKYLQIYLDEVIEPKLNRELVGEDDEPIKIKVYDVKHFIQHSTKQGVGNSGKCCLRLFY